MTKIQHLESQSESPAENRRGRARVMLVLSQLRPGGAWVQHVLLALGRWRGASQIDALSFIHFARLAVIPRFPPGGGTTARLRHPLQLFESNYNGEFDPYIDSFVHAARTVMYELWGTSYGFPGAIWARGSWFPLPLGPFKRLIQCHEYEVDHYYAAYPAATVTMVGSALRIAEAHAIFHTTSATLPPADFKAAYRSFIAGVQEDL